FVPAKKGFFRGGIRTSGLYITPGGGRVGAILVDMITGLQSALTYVGAPDLPAFHDMSPGSRYQNCLDCHVKVHGSNRNRFFFR
ncbi:MAG TPA: hypothetical protein PKE00_13665, partial [Planctomycetota bacterium]|nr:hypothetical protein [Planctomycetota bacterium]